MDRRKNKMEHHHVAFNRYAWLGHTALKGIRNDTRIIPPLDHDTHRETHKSVSHVPPLSYQIASRALQNFQEYGNKGYLQNIDNLQFSIEDAMLHPRVDTLERGVAELTVLGLELQKSFIAECHPRIPRQVYV